MPPERHQEHGRRVRFHASFRAFLSAAVAGAFALLSSPHPRAGLKHESSRLSQKKSRIVAGLKWTGVIAGVLVLGFVFGWVPYFLVSLFAFRGFKMTDKENAGLTPASFKLAYEDVSFQAKDGVPLSGWWVPAHSPRGTVVLVHGLNRSRIEMVGKVPFLHEQGWNALLFDLRFHGESGGKMRSLGFFEREDVHAAIDLARQRSPGPVVLWGVSVGARHGHVHGRRRSAGRRGRLRQQLPQPARHHALTTWPSSGASAGGCARCRSGPCRTKCSSGSSAAPGSIPTPWTW